MNDESTQYHLERICPECGRKFVPTSQWAYRMSQGTKYIYFCRYNCHRAAEKRYEAKKRGKKELKNNKPTKEALAADLKAGMNSPAIAKKYGCSTACAHKWVQGYGLQDLQAVRKPKGEPYVVNTQAGRTASPMTSGVGMTEGVGVTQGDNDMVQVSPSLNEIEQFHTDNPVQELPKVEMDKIEHLFVDDPQDMPPTIVFKSYTHNDHKVEILGGYAFPILTPERAQELRHEVDGPIEPPTWTQEEWESSIKEKWEGESEPQGMTEPEPGPEPQVMTEEENMSDAEWEAQALRNDSGPAPTDEATPNTDEPREPFFEVWQNLFEDAAALKRSYVTKAEMDFEDRLLLMFSRLGTRAVGQVNCCLYD